MQNLYPKKVYLFFSENSNSSTFYGVLNFKYVKQKTKTNYCRKSQVTKNQNVFVALLSSDCTCKINTFKNNMKKIDKCEGKTNGYGITPANYLLKC